jgi:hypothetical protein
LLRWVQPASTSVTAAVKATADPTALDRLIYSALPPRPGW